MLSEQLRNRLEMVENRNKKQLRQAVDIAIKFSRTKSAQKSRYVFRRSKNV